MDPKTEMRGVRRRRRRSTTSLLQMIDSRAAERTDGRMIGILPRPSPFSPHSIARHPRQFGRSARGVSEIRFMRSGAQVAHVRWRDARHFLSRWSRWHHHGMAAEPPPPPPSDGLSCVNMCLVSLRSVTMSSRVTFHLPLPIVMTTSTFLPSYLFIFSPVPSSFPFSMRPNFEAGHKGLRRSESDVEMTFSIQKWRMNRTNTAAASNQPKSRPYTRPGCLSKLR